MDSSDLEPGQRKVPQKVFWVTSAIAELFDREYYLLILSRELIFYIIFLFCITFAAVIKIDNMSYYMTHAVKYELVKTKFKTISNQYITFTEIRTIDQFYDYLDQLVVQKIFMNSFSNLEPPSIDVQTDRGLLYYNRLLGQPTLRQVTAKNISCHPRFSKYFEKCYAGFSRYTRSKEKLNLYGLPDKYLPQSKILNGTKNVGTQATSFWGKIALYEPGGFQKRLGKTQEQFKDNVDALKFGNWYRPETRAIFLDMQFYNPHIDLFSVVKLIFEVPPTGQLIPTSSITTFQCEKEYTNKVARIAEGCMIVSSLFILYYLAEELRQIVYFKAGYLGMFWTYVNWIILITTILHLSYYLTEKIECWAYYKEFISNTTTFYPLQRLARLETINTNAQGTSVFFVYLKLLKYSCLNTNLGRLYFTLSSSKIALRDLFCLFAIAIFAFITSGHIFFGSQVEEFSTMGLSLTTLLRPFVGDFYYKEIEKYYWQFAPIYFTAYIIILIFILLSLFLAVLATSFNEIKTDMGIAPFRIQLCGFWCRGCVNFLKDCGCHKFIPTKLSKKSYSATAEEIRTIIKRCGFSDLDIDMFMTRYNIDPHEDFRRQDMSRLIETIRTPTVEIPQKRVPRAPLIPVSSKSIDWTNFNSLPKREKMITVDDFKAQQNRIDRVENIMGVIAEKLEKLLKMMNNLDERRIKYGTKKERK